MKQNNRRNTGKEKQKDNKGFPYQKTTDTRLKLKKRVYVRKDDGRIE